MSEKISQKELENILWKACDTFRGTIDPAQYKDYILTILFVKYVSDVWRDRRDLYLQKYSGDTARADYAMRQERFQVPDHCTFDYLYENRNDANIGELINIALHALEEANRAKLTGVFRNIDFNSESNLGRSKDRNGRLKQLLKDFDDKRLDLRPSIIGKEDIIGNAYEYMIAHFASDAGKKGGEFYTPGDVATLLAKLLQPQPGARICDPACGSGSLLIRVAHEVGTNNYSLYGQENNGSTWALCKMNMFLHEMDNARIEWGDTILDPKLLEDDILMKFDIVAANPPFSLDKWGAEQAASDRFGRFWRGVPPKSKGDFAFISHMIETTYEQTGKVGVIVPHGVLFRGSSEGKIRQKLVEDNLLEAVISLPSNLFFGTGIPAAILLFNRSKQTSDVLFIDASHDFIAGKSQNTLGETNIEKIVAAFRAGETIAQYAYRASIEEIRENGFNLNIPRYVDTFEEEEEIDLRAVQKEIEHLEDELAGIKETMHSYLRELGFMVEVGNR